MTRRDKANYMIQSVTHALDVLIELAKGPGEIGVTELSKRLRLHKNNVFRLLATLELKSFVEQNKATEDYRLGAMLMQLGQAFSLNSTLVSRATPIVRALSEELGETISLATYQNESIHFPISFESKRPVRVSARIGMSMAAKSCAVGRLLTAQMSDADLAEVLAGNSTQDVAIKSQLNELRNSGQIIDRGAIEADVVSLSRVVTDINGNVIGAIEIVAPQYRAKPENYIPSLEKACKDLSTALGAMKGSGIVAGLSSQIQKEVSGTAATSNEARVASAAAAEATASRVRS